MQVSSHALQESLPTYRGLKQLVQAIGLFLQLTHVLSHSKHILVVSF